VSGDGVSSSLSGVGGPLGGGPLGGPLGGLPPLGGPLGGGLESSPEPEPVPEEGMSVGGFGASVGILIFVSTVAVTSTDSVVVDDQSSQAEWVVVLLSGIG
jgi:hypothetical protein